MTRAHSPLEAERMREQLKLPKALHEISKIAANESAKGECPQEISQFFPKLKKYHSPHQITLVSSKKNQHMHPFRVGVLFSGGQAPGGHNVVLGLFEALLKLHPESRLFGFLGGPSGLIENNNRELSLQEVEVFRNSGGFDLLGSGRTKIETPDQFEKAINTVELLDLNGLVIIGGDDSNTNAAHLAEFFLSKGQKTVVIGIPKTIDGDLKSSELEISFGFDTAAKVYSDIIGNIARDAVSAKKYTHFVKLMGRSASHITLECALQTHPNMALIGEEVASKEKTLRAIAVDIANIILQRNLRGKNYGVILIPEGLIEFVPEMKKLISELNRLVGEDEKSVRKKLSPEAQATFSVLPEKIQRQLLLDRDPHGNVQVSQIASEELFIELVKRELKDNVSYKGKFSPIAHFLGYEGRSAFPSNFDAHYTYALGYTAAALIQLGKTGYMATISELSKEVSEWLAGGIPILSLMRMEERKGKETPVVAKKLVDLHDAPFLEFKEMRESWKLEDDYRYPGPIQFSGPSPLVNSITMTLTLESDAREKSLR